MRVRILALLAVLGLAGCAAEPEWASEDMVSRNTYKHDGPPRLTLYTMISNSSGQGAHTSLMINASQRVAFDPAGSFRHEHIAVRNDVVFGMTPYLTDTYTRFHARKTYHVVVQKLDVSAEVAEAALRRVMAYGAVSKAHCAHSTSDILNDLPGFEGIKQTYYPVQLMEQFADLGASYDRLYETDEDDKTKVLKAFVPEYLKGKSDKLALKANATVSTSN